MVAKVQPATRVYVFLIIFCSLVHVTGLPAPALFAIDRTRLFELWRPFTSVSYLGPPSMSMANSIYFLLMYGQMLESSNGTGAHAWFLLVQICILTALGVLLGFPSQAQAMIAAIVYVSSRVNPMEKMYVLTNAMLISVYFVHCTLKRSQVFVMVLRNTNV